MSVLNQAGLEALMGGGGPAALSGVPAAAPPVPSGVEVEKAVVADGVKWFQVGQGDPFKVDIVRAINLWCDRYQETFEGDKNERYTRFVVELGGGDRHNAAEALKFFNLLMEKNEALKKSTFPELCSADATASTASA